MQRFGVNVQFLDAGGDIDRVARRGNQGRRLEVPHYHNLLFDAGGKRRGDNRCADLLCPLLEAEPACEKIIIEGNLDDVVFGEARGGQKPGGAFGPVAKVIASKADDDGFTRHAGGRMDAHDITQRDGEHIVGIAFLQVFLCREGQFAQRVHVLDVFEIDAVGVEGLLVESDVAIDPVERGLQPFNLELLDILTRHCLTLRIVILLSRPYIPHSSILLYSLPRYAR